MNAPNAGDELPSLSHAKDREIRRIIATLKERGSAVSEPSGEKRSRAAWVEVVRLYTELELDRPCDGVEAAEFAISRLSDWPATNLNH